MPRRIVIRIELTADAKDRLVLVCRNRGMTQVALLSRLVEWFATLPESIQAAIVGQYPQEIAPDVARLILQRMAGEDAGET